jgi:hypothetical protein
VSIIAIASLFIFLPSFLLQHIHLFRSLCIDPCYIPFREHKFLLFKYKEMNSILPLQWLICFTKSFWVLVDWCTQTFVQNVVHINQAFVAVIMEFVSCITNNRKFVNTQDCSTTKGLDCFTFSAHLNFSLTFDNFPLEIWLAPFSLPLEMETYVYIISHHKSTLLSVLCLKCLSSREFCMRVDT